MEEIQTSGSETTAGRRPLSLILLGVLCVIGGTILWIQNHYDPSHWREQAGPTPPGTAAPAIDRLEGLTPLSPLEQYDSRTLSDKINGKADLYLSAGFKSLASRRFAMTSDNARWLERFVYHMNGHRNAYAVYSAQRRKDIQPVDLTEQAYVSANGLFFVHGPYYVEIIASEVSEAMKSHMIMTASAFVQAHPVAPEKLPEIDLFPSEDRVPSTIRLISDSAFGIQGLDWVYTSDYASDRGAATAFISRRPSHADARAAADAFTAFWNEFGAEAVEPPTPVKGIQITFILDNYEIAVARGDYLFGVHEATQLEFGLEVIERLNRAIGEVTP